MSIKIEEEKDQTFFDVLLSFGLLRSGDTIGYTATDTETGIKGSGTNQSAALADLANKR
jgi:hypothetical protein